MKSCSVCEASYGIKFSEFTCSLCENSFCKAHIINKKFLIYEKIFNKIKNNDGVCYTCLLKHYRKDDEYIEKPKGITGRLKNIFKQTIYIFKDNPLDLIKIKNSAFVDIVEEKSSAMLLHQKNISEDFIINDLSIFARIYAVNIGLKNERDICLNDIYRVIGWLKSHPKIPRFFSNISWNTIENTSHGIDIIKDVWHITSVALTLSNPASSIIYTSYHIGDRIADQFHGKGIPEMIDESILGKIGANINIKSSFYYWLAGNIILRLYKKD